jgi:hypothetical protein
MLSRRALLGSAASVATSLFIPGRSAAATPSARKFVFVFCPGGWDPAFVFAPVFNDTIARFAADQKGQVGDIPFTDSPTRPSVRTFLERYGTRTAFVNGVEVPSVAHDVCTKWAMCGDSRASRDDWVSVIAGHADPSLLLPNVHISGPIFPTLYTSASVRIGSNGQLAGLLSGEALARTTMPVPGLDPAVVPLEDALLQKRLDRWTGARSDPMGQRYGATELQARQRAVGLVDHVDTLAGDTSELPIALGIAAGCLEAGLSRTAIVGYGVGGNGKWDTHSVNDFQDMMFDHLFHSLLDLADRLDATPGEQGGTLLDETVIVALSEMGRTPHKNAADGKDHWTWTSAMVMGSGVRGGVIGEWTEGLTGEPISLETGKKDENGASLLPGHVGATLLALADIDPAEILDPTEGEIIPAMLA